MVQLLPLILSLRHKYSKQPLNQNKMKSRQDRVEEMAAYGTMIAVGIVSLICIIVLITTLIYG